MNLVREILWLAGRGDQLKIANTLADRHVRLMRVDHTRKWDVVPLTMGSFRQQVFILRKQKPTEFTRAVQYKGIGSLVVAVFLCCQDIDPALAKPLGIAPCTFSSM
jgi:hypothetical protein